MRARKDQPCRWLAAVAERYPLSFHSVGLSLESAGGLIADELEALAALCDRYTPAQVSEHLSWSGSADDRYPDLLPLPYPASRFRFAPPPSRYGGCGFKSTECRWRNSTATSANRAVVSGSGLEYRHLPSIHGLAGPAMSRGPARVRI